MLPIVLLACAGAALALPTNLTLEYPFPSLQATPTRRRHAYRQEASASLSASASSFSHPPTASQLGMSPKDALKLAYGFDPAYDLDAVEPYDRDEVISLQAWKDRDMQSFTRFYFDSFYDSSSTYDTVQQFLMSPEIDWPNGQCDIASGPSPSSGPQAALTPVQTGRTAVKRPGTPSMMAADGSPSTL